jgi:hypothetical protein
VAEPCGALDFATQIACGGFLALLLVRRRNNNGRRRRGDILGRRRIGRRRRDGRRIADGISRGCTTEAAFFPGCFLGCFFALGLAAAFDAR